MLIDDETRFDGVTAIGVDDSPRASLQAGGAPSVWRHTRLGDKYVTAIIDLAPIRDGTGPARLLDMVEGRSKAVFKTWLVERPLAWRDAVEVVAMVPRKREVPPPFHVVRLAGDALDQCRRRVQQAIHGYRGRAGGRQQMAALIESLSGGVPQTLVEVVKLGRMLKKRAADILAYFDHPRTSNGPTEAINGRLDRLRGSVLGFRNLTNYIAPSLLESGGFRPRLHPGL